VRKWSRRLCVLVSDESTSVTYDDCGVDAHTYRRYTVNEGFVVTE
jgi:hypothetical protein